MLLSQRGLIFIDCSTVTEQAVDAFQDFITHTHKHFFELNVIFCKSIKA